MSTRYGIGLALEPGFTSRAYRARQLICGQYASWAAEMHMVYLAVSGFFQCPDPMLDQLKSDVSTAAALSREAAPQFPLSHLGVAGGSGDIYLDFAVAGGHSHLARLHGQVTGALEAVSGLESDESGTETLYQARLPLMQHANLPEAVFQDALEFARAVTLDLRVPAATQAWRLLLLRFESSAAGDDWSGGRWAADLRWELLASIPL